MGSRADRFIRLYQPGENAAPDTNLLQRVQQRRIAVDALPKLRARKPDIPRADKDNRVDAVDDTEPAFILDGPVLHRNFGDNYFIDIAIVYLHFRDWFGQGNVALFRGIQSDRRRQIAASDFIIDDVLVKADLAEGIIDLRLQLRQTKEFLRNMDNKVTGILRLGVLRPILPSILKQFLEQYPDVEVRVMTDWSSNLVHSVYSQHVHIGMLRGDYDWPDGKHLMMEENICIVSKHEIHLQDLPSLPRINYKTEPSLKNTMDLWWKERYSLPPNIAMEVDKMETGKEMVLNGLGYAILPTIVLGGQEDLYKINLTSKHGEPWKRKSWMIYRKESLNLTLIKEFVDFMKNRDLETPKRR